MKKWMTKDLRERFNQIKHKEFELRKEYDRLHSQQIQVKTFEEFCKDKKYRDQFRKQTRGKIRIPEILANSVVLFEQTVYDYELYLRRAEESYRNRVERGFGGIFEWHGQNGPWGLQNGSQVYLSVF